MEVVADRLSIRWFLGYDLTEPLPDHFRASLGSETATGSRSFGGFSKRSWRDVHPGRVGVGRGVLFRRYQGRGQRFARESITPRFAIEQHLQDLFEEDPQDSDDSPSDAARATIAEKISIRFPPQKIRSSSAPTLPEASGSPKLGAKIGKSRATSTGAKGGPLPQQERSRCLAHEAQGRRPYPPRGYQAHCVVDLKARRVSSWVFWCHPLRGHREQAHAGYALEIRLQVEELAPTGDW
jgi:hypothetical protein